MAASICQPYIINEHIMEEIIYSKERFITNNISPMTNEYVRPEVAESWIRSREHGLLPDQKVLTPKLSDEKWVQVEKENQGLLKIVRPIFENFKKMVVITEYALTLHEKNYVNILEEGNCNVLEPQGGSAGIGHVLAEEFFGTSVLNLAMSFGQPVQIVGSEHYSNVMNGHISSAAPIYDQNQKLLGCICLIVAKQSPLWTPETYLLQASALGWVSALAMAVMNQYRLDQKNMALTKANHTLDATFSLLDEGVLIVDKTGCIVDANKTSSSILGQTVNELKGKYLKDFLKQDSGLPARIAQNIQINHVEDTIVTSYTETNCYFSTCPILDEPTNRFDGAVIRLNSIKKYQHYITSHGNSLARYTFDHIIGRSEAIEQVIKRAQRYALSQENILLTGDSGTGKELFAQSIHNMSRQNGPFVAINCGALPRSLIESELFGYEGGAFTGAERNGRIGKIEMADGGTLFLDEIGEMPIDMQAVLLRVLDNKCVMRIGGNRLKYVDFRLIAATNQNLQKLIAEKSFREDLYYRLSSLTLHIPSLVERENDVQILAEHFIRKYCYKMNREPVPLSQSAVRVLKKHSWPGNVRQLEKAIVSALYDCQENIIDINDFPQDVRSYFIEEKAYENSNLSLRELEELRIRKLLKENHDDVSKVADCLGIGLSTLYRRLKAYKIRE